MKRRTLAALVLLVWVSSLGWLALRQYGGGPREEEGWPVPPGSIFQSIRLGTRQIGLASLTVDTLAEGLRVTEMLTVDLPASDTSSRPRTAARTDALYTKGLRLIRWRTDLLTERGRTSSTGVVVGDSALEIVSSRGEESETLRIALRRPVVLPNAAPFVARLRGMLRENGRLSLDVFDPIDLAVRAERFAVRAESVFVVADSAEYQDNLKRWAAVHADTLRAWRLDGVIDRLHFRAWVDAAGMPVQSEHAIGATLERSAFELVSRNYRARPHAAWGGGQWAPTVSALLPPAGRAKARARFTARLRLEGGDSVSDIAALSGGMQRVRGDTLVVSLGPTEPDSAAGHTAPLLVQADDSAVAQVLAGAGVRGLLGPEEAARRINAWLRRSITLREGPAAFSAGRVLARRQASPGEAALTLARLLQGAGLEAHPVWGLVWRAPVWYVTSWVEVRAGTVFAVDPAVPRVPADPDRIRLGAEGMPRLLDLLLVAGRLRPEPLAET